MRFPIISFNAGELSAQIDARSDVAKYASGLRVLENMIPRIYGSAERRPGFMYIDDVYDHDVVSRLVEFEYSNTVAYVIEFSNLKCKFYTDGGVLQSGGVDVTLTTPYLEADLFGLQFKQSNDVMWIIHPDYAPRKLTRTSATAFSLDVITFVNGPFLPRNDIEEADDVTMTPSVIAEDATGTLTASAATFVAGHVGALFKLTQPRVNVITNGSRAATGVIGVAIDVEGPFTFNTHGTWTATVDLQRNEDGTNWETFRSFPGSNDRNIQFAGNEETEGVQYRINVIAWTSGTVEADITVDTSTQDGIVRVDSFTSTTIVNITVLAGLASTSATKRWYEGAWSAVRGYPTTVTFFEERTVYAGTATQPQTVWFSATGDFENFKTPVTLTASSSFSLTASSDKRNAIRWISGLESLIFGTIGGEWQIRSSSLDQPITPTNFSMKQQTSYGSAAMQALQVGDVLLFADFVGRKVREVTWSDQKAKYVAPDLSALAEHITKTGITSMAYQRNPDSIVWMTLADGSLVSMTYERDQDVIAWAKHPIGGTDAKVESVAVIPGSSEDEVWISTSRTIGGVTKRFVEQMQPRDWGDDAEDAWFVDAGLKYDSTAASTITGLTHLIGETVSILGDGAVFADEVVDASGEITLDETVSVAIVGLSNRWKLKPMRADVNLADGNTKGSIKKITEVVISLLKAGGVEYGTDTDDLRGIDFRTTEDYDSPPALFTGDKVITFDGGFSSEDSVLLTGNEPLPVTIRALVYRGKVSGR